MKTKVLSLMVGSVLALTAFGGTANAAAGGVPSDNACHGQVVKFLNGADGAFGDANGIQPSDIAKFFGISAGEVNKIIKAICA